MKKHCRKIKTMWRNVVIIHSGLKKNLRSKILNQFNIKKIKSTKIILEKKKNHKKIHVGKHHSNP
jgi:hypothetical protein